MHTIPVTEKSQETVEGHKKGRDHQYEIFDKYTILTLDCNSKISIKIFFMHTIPVTEKSQGTVEGHKKGRSSSMSLLRKPVILFNPGAKAQDFISLPIFHHTFELRYILRARNHFLCSLITVIVSYKLQAFEVFFSPFTIVSFGRDVNGGSE